MGKSSWTFSMTIREKITQPLSAILFLLTGWSISYRKCILQITHPSQYRYAKLQYRFAVISGSPSRLPAYLPSFPPPDYKTFLQHTSNVYCTE